VTSFRVFGRPAPQGSKKSVGRGRFIEASKYLPAWRAEVKQAAEENKPDSLYSGELALEVVFYLEKPKTVKRDAPTVPPDLDKLIRGICDAMTGTVYEDDAQICKVTAFKKYASDTNPPGAFIQVTVL
jgi:crossover junction endodeoxyribonuclease RusA